MGRRTSPGELARFAEGQMRVGKRQAGNGGGGIEAEVVAVGGESYVDAGVAEHFEIAIKAADVELQAAGEGDTALRPLF